MLHSLHILASRARRSPRLRRYANAINAVEPVWNTIFSVATRRRGFPAVVNGETVRLEYRYGARYDRADHREYEPHFYRPFVDSLRPGMTVIDVGAHIGFFTIGAARRVGPTGQVHAFEPAALTLSALRHHVRLNDVADRVAVFGGVACDVVGEATFYAYRDSMAASLARSNVEDLNPEARTERAAELTVPAITLDRYCAEREITPDVIKIDVEGAECHVLRGAADILRRHRPLIWCEIHPKQMENCGSSLGELQALLDALAYRMTPMTGPNHVGIFPARLEHAGAEIVS